jgi:hypothetical protein
LREIKQFLASIQESKLNYFDKRIKNKIDLLKIEYISVKNNLFNDLNKQCELALKNLGKGEFSKALGVYVEIVENLDVNNIKRAGD